MRLLDRFFGPNLRRLVKEERFSEIEKLAFNDYLNMHSTFSKRRVYHVVDKLIRMLGDSNGDVSKKAIEALSRIGYSAVGSLINALDYDNTIGANNWRVREGAVTALAKIGKPAVMDLISTFTRHTTLRLAAPRVLGKIGPVAVEPLIAALTNGDRLVREGAVEALGKCGWQPDRTKAGAAYWIAQGEWGRCVEIGEPAITPLITILEGHDSDMQQAAARTLGKIGDPRAVQPLIAALEKDDLSVCAAAVSALGQIGAPAVEPLITALDKEPPGGWGAPLIYHGSTMRNEWRQLREYATQALGQIGAPAVEPLIVALKDVDGVVRLRAIQALGQIGDARAVVPLITALKDGSEAAAEALGRIGDARAIKPLIIALKGGHRPVVRSAAAKALGKIGGASAIEQLITALRDEDWTVRWHVIESLGQIGDVRAVEPLIVALKEKFEGWDPNVNKDIAKALGQIGDARAVKPLIDVLKDNPLHVCQAAAEALKVITKQDFGPGHRPWQRWWEQQP